MNVRYTLFLYTQEPLHFKKKKNNTATYLKLHLLRGRSSLYTTSARVYYHFYFT